MEGGIPRRLARKEQATAAAIPAAEPRPDRPFRLSRPADRRHKGAGHSGKRAAHQARRERLLEGAPSMTHGIATLRAKDSDGRNWSALRRMPRPRASRPRPLPRALCQARSEDHSASEWLARRALYSRVSLGNDRTRRPRQDQPSTRRSRRHGVRTRPAQRDNGAPAECLVLEPRRSARGDRPAHCSDPASLRHCPRKFRGAAVRQLRRAARYRFPLRDETVVAAPVVGRLMSEIVRLQIDALIVDPFVSSHRVPENDNGAIDAVAKTWSRIGRTGNCAVEVAHHIRKPASGSTAEITVDDARGAGALRDAGRSLRVLNVMSKEEAETVAIKPSPAQVLFPYRRRQGQHEAASRKYRLEKDRLGSAR